MWRGPPLAEFADLEFARSEIARLVEVRLAATEDLARAELALGRHAEIVGELGALVSATLLHENLTGYPSCPGGSVHRAALQSRSSGSPAAAGVGIACAVLSRGSGRALHRLVRVKPDGG